MSAQPVRSSTSLPKQPKSTAPELQLLPAYPEDDSEVALSILAGSAFIGLILGAVATGGVIRARRNRHH